ncbi:MAG TPA: RsmG family class I SAM-dependent methyltransferase [Pyrinomonadaceae bacterium]|nr:RsmG family class I SAM-dependent methyltransferase [Pyrinomonadaceae bacterium]
MLLNKIVNHDLFFSFNGMNEQARFEETLSSSMASYDLALSSETLTQLGDYYRLLTRWNDRLHLVAPCTPEQFATRHVLESLLLLKHLPHDAKIADVGSGGGLPIIPCLIARADLEATLIESSQKKAVFLREALNAVDRKATIIARRFEEIEAPEVSFVSCRALDQFTEKLPELIEWTPKGATLLLFGGEGLLPEAKRFLIPGSDRRFLIIFKDG